MMIKAKKTKIIKIIKYFYRRYFLKHEKVIFEQMKSNLH